MGGARGARAPLLFRWLAGRISIAAQVGVKSGGSRAVGEAGCQFGRLFVQKILIFGSIFTILETLASNFTRSKTRKPLLFLSFFAFFENLKKLWRQNLPPKKISPDPKKISGAQVAS